MTTTVFKNVKIQNVCLKLVLFSTSLEPHTQSSPFHSTTVPQRPICLLGDAWCHYSQSQNNPIQWMKHVFVAPPLSFSKISPSFLSFTFPHLYQLHHLLFQIQHIISLNSHDLLIISPSSLLICWHLFKLRPPSCSRRTPSRPTGAGGGQICISVHEGFKKHHCNILSSNIYLACVTYF